MYLAALAHIPPSKGLTLRGRGGRGHPSTKTHNRPLQFGQVMLHNGKQCGSPVCTNEVTRAATMQDRATGKSNPPAKQRLMNSEPRRAVTVSSGEGVTILQGLSGMFVLDRGRSVPLLHTPALDSVSLRQPVGFGQLDHPTGLTSATLPDIDLHVDALRANVRNVPTDHRAKLYDRRGLAGSVVVGEGGNEVGSIKHGLSEGRKGSFPHTYNVTSGRAAVKKKV